MLKNRKFLRYYWPFIQMDDVDTILEQQNKAQLITFIKQLLQKQPEVEWQLTMPPLSDYKSVPIDTDKYRRQVDAAFQHAGRERDAVYGISHDLYAITSTAAHCGPFCHLPARPACRQQPRVR